MSNRLKGRRAAKESTFGRDRDTSSRALYNCNYCQKDISNIVRIKCAVCPDFDLCLECFSVGAEVNPHKRTHDYRVVDNLSFPLYDPDWGADEELLLLEGIETFGMGNWVSIADHVGTKSKEQCRAHYFRVYIDCSTFPLPSPVPEMAEVNVEERVQEARAGRGAKRLRLVQEEEEEGSPSKRPATPGKLEGDAAGPTADAARASGPAEAVAAAAAAAASAEATDGQQSMEGAETNGDGSDHPAKKAQQQPLEAGNSDAAAAGTEGAGGAAGTPHATKGVRSRTVSQDGAPGAGAKGTGTSQAAGDGTAAKEPAAVERAQRHAPPTGADASGYHAKRREFDPEYDNDAEMVIAEMEFLPEDSEADVAEKLRMLEIYNARLDERERRRDFVLAHGLLNMRRAQGAEKRRTVQEKEMYAALRVFERFQSVADHEALVDGLLMEQNLRARIAELQEYRAHGVRTMADADLLDAARPPAPRDGGSSTGTGTATVGPAAAAGSSGGGPGRVAIFSGVSGVAWGVGSGGGTAAGLGVLAGVGGVGGAAGRPVQTKSRRLTQLDVTLLPGVELLSKRERELCASCRLLPSFYLSLKDRLLRAAEERGTLTRAQAREVLGIDHSYAHRIYELATSCGWVTAPKATVGLASSTAAADHPEWLPPRGKHAAAQRVREQHTAADPSQEYERPSQWQQASNAACTEGDDEDAAGADRAVT